ncbi:hypothetical protein [Microbacterium binotii]|uniref:hypothetical protein n=1 Tax=Microbacterium binotii TaxID=462710 RepID=UPI001F2B99B5|nr:hypothetical protein [Microbacterium binotii]UIN29479.1 hypothetical protein LXM64_09940 [Microbacterium binotii]
MTDENPVVSGDDEFVDAVEDDQFDALEEDDEPAAPPQYGVWPFSIREVVLLGIWALAFIVSFFSLSYFAPVSVWTMGIAWVLTIGLPTVAVFLIVLRRLSPQGIRRVGSLGIDQFASVAFAVSAVVWVQMIWESFALPGLGSWVHWVELVLMAAGVVFTAIAPFIPGLKDDFEYRAETVSHRVARGARPIAQRPAPEPVAYTAAPAATYPVAHSEAGWAPSAEPVRDEAAALFATTGDVYADPHAQTAAYDEGLTPAAEPATEQIPVSQAFWALVPEEREVLDEMGVPIFRVDATAWALVIEDRGEVFVVRHEDGRIGYLHDVSGVTRG